MDKMRSEMDKMNRRQALAAAGGLVVGATIPAVAQAELASTPAAPPNLHVNVRHILYVSTGWKKGGGHTTQVVIGHTRDIVAETLDDIMRLVREAKAKNSNFIPLHKAPDIGPVFEITPDLTMDPNHFTGGCWIGGEALRGNNQHHLRTFDGNVANLCVPART